MEEIKKEKAALNLSLDADLIKKLKHKAIDDDTDVSTLIEKAVKDLLD